MFTDFGLSDGWPRLTEVRGSKFLWKVIWVWKTKFSKYERKYEELHFWHSRWDSLRCNRSPFWYNQGYSKKTFKEVFKTHIWILRMRILLPDGLNYFRRKLSNIPCLKFRLWTGLSENWSSLNQSWYFKNKTQVKMQCSHSSMTMNQCFKTIIQESGKVNNLLIFDFLS